MKDFHLCSWLISYDLSKISAKLVISLKHNVVLQNFVKYYWMHQQMQYHPTH